MSYFLSALYDFLNGIFAFYYYIIISIKIDGLCSKFRLREGPKPPELENIFTFFVIGRNNEKIEKSKNIF